MDNKNQFSTAGREFCSNVKQRGYESNAARREIFFNRPGELQVSGTAEVCCPADRASVRIRVSNIKESVSAVTNSVIRRLDYIIQALRQHGISEEDTSVSRFLYQDKDQQYCMDAEVVVTFSDFHKMDQIRCILLEKLDNTVCVWLPQFYHSPECLSQIRQKAFVSAVENAQQKASKVTELLGQSLGSPRLIREEETKECRNEVEGGSRPGSTGFFPYVPTVTASSQVSVFFSLGGRGQKTN